MLSRFEGPAGFARLVDALRRQRLVHSDTAIAEQFARTGTLRFFAAGAHVVSEDGDDNSVFFLLTGAGSIRVRGREVALRRAGEHVGEMAAIDPAAPRSASVIAVEPTVALELSDVQFLHVADANPRVWHAVATTLAERLRERDQYVRPRRGPSGLFIGCSVEALPIARAVQVELDHDPVIVTTWTNAVFGASQTALDSLEAQLVQTDFAVVVLSPDDTISSRGRRRAGPRDNVIFELGLFAGALGRGRTFMLIERGADLKLPSDLVGITPITYKPGGSDTLSARIAPACEEIRRAILSLGPR
ncbi:TIR domain-containing protein [Longimicrobium sp.]|jgi:predicted nucleotide-binding protein|uniref:TIR domain-containing protein n=1 Tax=Longimicrobium sp. TaxID=2029185 RepID=UPI0039C997DF